MDPVKILKRAWHILWSYRALWVFGLIIALTAAGSSGGGGNNGSRISTYEQDSYQPESLPDAIRYLNEEMGRIFNENSQDWNFAQGELNTILWIVGIFALIMVVFGIVMTVARYVSETAVIRMVDEYENTDTKMTVREGFRIGWSRTSWRLFLIDLIANSLIIIWFIALISSFIGLLIATDGDPAVSSLLTIGITGIATVIPIAILTIGLNLLRRFAWRVCALEDIGVLESFSRGWALIRENWMEVGIMWIVMIGLGFAWFFVSLIAFFVTFPIMIITVIAALAIVVIPALLLVGLFSLFLSTPLAWMFGILYVLPLFFTIAFSHLMLIESWKITFTSTVWTLTYREIKAIPTKPPAELPAES